MHTSPILKALTK